MTRSTETRPLNGRYVRALVLSACVCAAGSLLAEDSSRQAVGSMADAAEAVHRILQRWEPVALEAGAHTPGWREMIATQLRLMETPTLEGIDEVRPARSADAKGRYAAFTQAMRSALMQSYQLAAAGKGWMKLGSAATDQVFIPIAPCRIVDTRNEGGVIAAGETRNFYFYGSSLGDWSEQGGVAGPLPTTCPGTILPNGGPPSAAVITVTVVAPSAAGNWIIWGGEYPIPTISALNWNAGDIAANTTVAPWGKRITAYPGPGGSIRDFAVTYNGPSGVAHFVADVVGYLVENRATALDCYEGPIASAPVPGNSSAAIDSAACPAGWTLAGGNCDSDDHFRLRLLGKYGAPQGHWYCAYRNESAITRSIYASPICCRVPGR